LTDWRPYAEVHGSDNTVTGNVLIWPGLHSAGLGRSSEIVVYLPPSLGPDGRGWTDGRRYPTVYFNDGQNVFDERTANAGEWRADETLEMLAGEGLEAIGVAVPNSPARMDEYNPWRGPNPRDPAQMMGGRGEVYLEWLVGSVMALVDRSFPTSTEREATGIVGSSMGGLISLYALMFQPRAFGFAGVMSPSVRWNDYAALRMIGEGKLPPGRMHVDMGHNEWGGMVDDARLLRDALVAAGWREGHDLHYVEDHAGGHHESAWAWRLPDALRFLLAPFRGEGQSAHL
jgi:predicted alpha/beta superfamily hydrolase